MNAALLRDLLVVLGDRLAPESVTRMEWTGMESAIWKRRGYLARFTRSLSLDYPPGMTTTGSSVPVPDADCYA